jgi:predicted nucleic acid-binding protein
MEEEIKNKKTLLQFWEEQMKHSSTSSNYFFRKSPSHYHMMLVVMSAYKLNEKLSVEALKTRLFKTSRPKSAIMINEACEKGFFKLIKNSSDQRIKNIIPSDSFLKEFEDYLNTLKNIEY